MLGRKNKLKSPEMGEEGEMYFEGEKAALFAARLLEAGYTVMVVDTYVKVTDLSGERQLKQLERKEVLMLAHIYGMRVMYA